MPDARFVIDEERVAKIAAALAEVQPEEDWFVPSLPRATPSEEADFWCLVLAICQQTRTARGVVDDVAYRGSDYLVMKARARWPVWGNVWMRAAGARRRRPSTIPETA